MSQTAPQFKKAINLTNAKFGDVANNSLSRDALLSQSPADSSSIRGTCSPEPVRAKRRLLVNKPKKSSSALQCPSELLKLAQLEPIQAPKPGE